LINILDLVDKAYRKWVDRNGGGKRELGLGDGWGKGKENTILKRWVKKKTTER